MIALVRRLRRAWTDLTIAKDSFLSGFFLQRSEDKARRGESFEQELWRARGRGFRTGLTIALGLDTPLLRAERQRQYEADYGYRHPRDLHSIYEVCPSCRVEEFCDACNVCCRCGFLPPAIGEGYGCSECGGYSDDGIIRHTRTCSYTADAIGQTDVPP